jgi:hypothetical protein
MPGLPSPSARRVLSLKLRRQRILSVVALLAGLLVSLVGLMERPVQGSTNHQREITVVLGLFLATYGGIALLACLGKRDPLVPDEKYYNLIASKSTDRRPSSR